MSKLGDTLKKYREKQNLSIQEVSRETKIRSEIISNIEAGLFGQFKSEIYAKGLIGKYAHFLGLNKDKMVAMYRRESSQQPMESLAPKPDESSTDKSPNTLYRILNSRNFMIYLSIGITIFVFTVYGAIQLSSLLEAPYLSVFSPIEIEGEFSGEVFVTGNSFKIKGETAPQTIITFNSEVLELESGGRFETPEIPLKEQSTKTVIIATNQFGKTTKIEMVVKKGSKGIKTDDSLKALIEVEDEITAIKITTDNEVVFDDRAYVGDIISVEAEDILQVESKSPYNLKVTINGKQYRFTARTKTWKMIDGNIVEE